MIEAMACGTPVIAFPRGQRPRSLTTASQVFWSAILPKPLRPCSGSARSIASRPGRPSRGASPQNASLGTICRSIANFPARELPFGWVSVGETLASLLQATASRNRLCAGLVHEPPLRLANSGLSASDNQGPSLISGDRRLTQELNSARGRKSGSVEAQLIVSTPTGPFLSRTSTTTCRLERRRATSADPPPTGRPHSTISSRNCGGWARRATRWSGWGRIGVRRAGGERRAMLC